MRFRLSIRILECSSATKLTKQMNTQKPYTNMSDRYFETGFLNSVGIAEQQL